jgi:hypothetical protein
MNMAMTLDRVRSILSRISYKPDTEFVVGPVRGHAGYLQHVQYLPDCNNPGGGLTPQKGRKFLISSHAVTSEVLNTALLAVLLFEEHEAREHFMYRGKKLYGPHIDVSQIERRPENEF